MVHPLKAYRERQSLTQNELAELLGVTKPTVSRWEAGTRKVDQERLTKVAELTGIAPADLRPDLAGLFTREAC